MQNEEDATKRVERFKKLLDQKLNLELAMVPSLHRTNCEDPGVSIIPIMEREIKYNVHKSGARSFFDKNIYLNLKSQKEEVGLPNAGTHSVSEEVRQALQYVQNIRNKFLSISANKTGGIPSYDGIDPLPKALCRVAAQIIPNPSTGAWYDTRYGLEYIWEALSRRKTESALLTDLYRKISIRRGGRGQRSPLSNIDQLLLAEVLYDLAVATPSEAMATWDIRFEGVTVESSDGARIIENLRNLLPEAQIIGILKGSIIVRLRSTKRSYATIIRLEELGVLKRFFDVDRVYISSFGDEPPIPIESKENIDLIAEYISRWTPEQNGKDRVFEVNLIRSLEDWLKTSPIAENAMLAREVLIGDSERPWRSDILMEFPARGRDGRVAIEVVNLQSRSAFFFQIGRIYTMNLPTVLVLVGARKIINDLQGDINKVREKDMNIRFVTVYLEN